MSGAGIRRHTHRAGRDRKTSLALRVLHGVAADGDYFAILWFSARDIDLLAHGPAPVRPAVLDAADIAQGVRTLVGEDPKESRSLFETALTDSPFDQPLLFVFDNFETVRSPAELFRWVDTFVGPRTRCSSRPGQGTFRGDYPLAVGGMDDDEARALVRSTAERLGISGLLGGDYVQRLLEEAGGHPYIIKILLGEVAKAGRTAPIARVVADQDEVLAALFERTYADLSRLPSGSSSLSVRGVPSFPNSPYGLSSSATPTSRSTSAPRSRSSTGSRS